MDKKMILATLEADIARMNKLIMETFPEAAATPSAWRKLMANPHYRELAGTRDGLFRACYLIRNIAA